METDNKQNFCKDFYISFHQNASWKMDKFHFHDTYEILLCLSDGGEFFVGESTYPIKRGGLLVFNSMDLHRRDVYKRQVMVSSMRTPRIIRSSH